MIVSPLQQTLGNTCVGLAALLFLLPLQRLLSVYADRHINDDQWVPHALYILIPLWLALMGALLCVTASGGFDWLRLGRPALYAFAAGGALALGVVSFVFVGLYVRPGFTPRSLYVPAIYLIPLATLLLVFLSLNRQLAPGSSLRWLQWPWTIFAAVSLFACIGFFGLRLVRTGTAGVAAILYRVSHPGPSTEEMLARISTLGLENDFETLLGLASRHRRHDVREAALARLRALPKFLDRLSDELETGSAEPALDFLRHTALLPKERTRLARPARTALERWVARMPAANYTTKKHFKELRHWGEEMFQVLPEKFANTGVEFGPVMDDFKERVDPSN